MVARTSNNRKWGYAKIIFFFTQILLLFLTGCIATKVVTIPKRVAGKVVDFVPVVGGVAEVVVDTTVGAIDFVPL
jgi:hypothetical protein